MVMATVGGVMFAAGGTGGAATQPLAAEMYRPGEVVMAGSVDQVPAGYRVKKVLPNAGLVVLTVEKGKEQQHLGKLAAKGKKCGLNLKYHAFFQPNDPYYSFQWNLPMVQSEQAWDITAGSGVIVAVLDTGLKTGGAPDGIGCVSPGWDVVNNDSDPVDGDGHGTHVSGTVAQNTDNGTGVAGLAHDACVMPVKVLDDSGSGTSADLAEGVAYAVANGASVINMKHEPGLESAAQCHLGPDSRPPACRGPRSRGDHCLRLGQRLLSQECQLSRHFTIHHRGGRG